MVEDNKEKAFPLIRAMLIGGISQEARDKIGQKEIEDPNQVTAILVKAAKLTLKIDQLLNPIAREFASSPLSPSVEALARASSWLPLRRMAVIGDLELGEARPQAPALTAATAPDGVSAATQPPSEGGLESKKTGKGERMALFIDHAFRLESDGLPTFPTFEALIKETFANLLQPLEKDPEAYDRQLILCNGNARQMVKRIINLRGTPASELKRLAEPTKAALVRLESHPTASKLEGKTLEDFLLRKPTEPSQPIPPPAPAETSPSQPKPETEAQTKEKRQRDLTDKELATVLGFLKLSPDRKTTLAQGSSVKVARILAGENTYANFNSARVAVYEIKVKVENKLMAVLDSQRAGDAYPEKVKQMLEALKREPEYQGINLNQVCGLMFNRISVEEVTRLNQSKGETPAAVSEGAVVAEVATTPEVDGQNETQWEVTEEEFGMAIVALGWDGTRRKYSSVKEIVVDLARDSLEKIKDRSKKIQVFQECIDYTLQTLRSVADKLIWGRGNGRLQSQLPPKLSQLIEQIHLVDDGVGNKVYALMNNDGLRRALLFES